MGVIDVVTKDYIGENDIFADAFNYYVFRGRQVIKPEQLSSVPSEELVTLLDKKGKQTAIQKYRDVLKQLTVKEDGECRYMLLATENQTGVHYAMPVRCFFYDALRYFSQTVETAALHRKQGDTLTGDEYLSGFAKTDKLKPVVTLVIYFQDKEWNGARTLKELWVSDSYPPELLDMAADYRMNLIEPGAMGDSEFDLFKTSLGISLKLIKHMNDDLFGNVIADRRLDSVDVKAALVMNAVAGLGLKINEKEEVIDMCTGMERLLAERERKGRADAEKLLVEQKEALREKDEVLQEQKEALEQKDRKIAELEYMLAEKSRKEL